MKAFDILSFHPGRQHNFEQALQLQNKFPSFRHITSLHFNKRTIRNWERISPKISSNLNKRASLLEPSAVDTHAFPECRYLLKRSLGYHTGPDDFIRRNSQFQEWILRTYAPPKIFIGFDTSSWVIFEKWKNKSFLILDLTIAVPQYKLQLAKTHNLDSDLVENLTRNDSKFYAIYEKELELADLVLCGSEFVRQSCIALGVDASKLVVIPYGADLSKFNYTEAPARNTGIIKVAFIGQVTYRKGADVLLNVWQQLTRQFPNIELHFYGNKQMVLPDVERVFYHGFIKQEELINELRTADISVLPSFLEGSSYAIYQSMAMGLPVITTPNAGSVIEHNETGLLVTYGSTEELYRALYRLITEPELRKKLSVNALADIRQYTWDTYGDKLQLLLQEILCEPAFA